MRLIYFPACLLVTVSLSACASFQSAGLIAQGRQALFEGNNQAALGYFQAAAQVDPELHIWHRDCRRNFELSRQSSVPERRLCASAVDVGKSAGSAQGRQCPRLYLGLTLARQGETQKALPDIDSGMKGIYDLLNYITDTFRFGYGQYWDPGRDIRSAIEKSRAVMASGKIDWPTLIADGESVALKTEREPDQARQNRRTQQSLSAD